MWGSGPVKESVLGISTLHWNSQVALETLASSPESQRFARGDNRGYVCVANSRSASHPPSPSPWVTEPPCREPSAALREEGPGRAVSSPNSCGSTGRLGGQVRRSQDESRRLSVAWRGGCHRSRHGVEQPGQASPPTSGLVVNTAPTGVIGKWRVEAWGAAIEQGYR